MVLRRLFSALRNTIATRDVEYYRRKAPIRRRFESLEDRRMLSFDPSGMEQEMLEHINRMRMNPADELGVLFISTDSSDPNYFVSEDADVNTAVNFFGVDDTTLFNQWASLVSTSPLAWNENLTNAAETHNDRMILQDMQEHILPADAGLGLAEEDGLLARAVAAGFDWSGSVTVAENIFAYTESVFHGHAAFAIDWGATATGIQNPAGHRINIMDSSFQEVGISIVAESDTSTGVGPLVVTQDFAARGNYGNARVLGVAYDDGNGNGYYNAGEGLGGLTITISNSTAEYTTTTMTAGGYQVEVDPGTYFVTASGGNLTGTVSMGTVTVGSSNEKIDLDTNSLPTTGDINGYVFSDDDENGNFDGGESALSGVTVFLDENSDGLLTSGEQSTTTGGDGSYTFSGLDVGSHTVVVAEEAFYRSTSSASQSVQVTAGGLTTADAVGQFEFVRISGTAADVYGTSNADTFVWEAANPEQFTLNGDITSGLASVTTIDFHGQDGDDSVDLTGGGGDDDVTFSTTSVTLSATGYTIQGDSLETIAVDAGEGADQRAYFYDSVNKDTFTRSETTSTLTGTGFSNTAVGFDRSYAYSTQGGKDVATIEDESSNDTYTAKRDYAVLYETASTAFLVRVEGFFRVTANATGGGTDYAYFHDSTADDRFTGRPDSATMWTEDSQYVRKAEGFDRHYAYSTLGGDDYAYLYDDTTDDYFSFNGNSGVSVLRGNSYEFLNRVEDFTRVYAYGSGGDDKAYLYDGPNDDTFYGKPNQGILNQNDYGFYTRATTFEKVYAYSTAGGSDYAYLSDASSNDLFFGYSDYALLRGTNYEFFNRAEGFERAFGTASTGTDYAYLYDDITNDYLVSRPEYAILRGLNFEFFNRADNFDRVYAYATNGGSDEARFVDSDDDDEMYGRGDVAKITSGSYFTRSEGFGTITADSSAGGDDTTDVSSVNFSFNATGDWDS